MTNRELLQAILQNTESAKLELHGLKGEVKGLKDEVRELKEADSKIIKGRVLSLDVDMKEVKQELRLLRDDVRVILDNSQSEK